MTSPVILTNESPSHATFESQWDIATPTKVFGTLPPKPRAWERQPRQRQPLSSKSSNMGMKIRTIWKRNDFHDQSVWQPQDELPNQPLSARPEVNNQDEHDQMFTPDGKIVKRARLELNSEPAGNKTGAAMWDRRRSSLPHKIPKADQSDDHNELPKNYSFAPLHDPEISGLDDGQASEEESSETPGLEHGEFVATSDSADKFNTPRPEAVDFVVLDGFAQSSLSPQGIPFESEVSEIEHQHERQAEDAISDNLNTTPHRDLEPIQSPSEIQAAAAQHLENMRRELCSRPSRRGRRSTERIYSTINTRLQEQERRASISADLFSYRKDGDYHSDLNTHNSVHSLNLNPTEFHPRQAASSQNDGASGYETVLDIPMLDPGESHESDMEKSTDAMSSPILDDGRVIESKCVDEMEAEIEDEIKAILEATVESVVEAVNETSTKADGMPSENVVDTIEQFLSFPSSKEHQGQMSILSHDRAVLDEGSLAEAADLSPTVGFEENPSNGQIQADLMLPRELSEAAIEVTVEVPDAATAEGADKEANECLESLDSPDQPMPDAASDLEQHGIVSESVSLQQQSDLGDLQQRTDEGDSNKLTADGDQETLDIPIDSSETVSTVKVSLNDDDTDILKEFLSRAKASKAAKIANQSSLLNRRDSDVVKHALASPRRALEDLDANSPVPSKSLDTMFIEESSISRTVSLKGDAAPSPTARPLETGNHGESGERDELGDAQPVTRRSTRAADSANSSLKRALNSGSTPSTISVRRQDSSESIVLKKSEAQELAILTRTNTRRNKGGAMPARATLMKLKGIPVDDVVEVGETATSDGKVRWNEKLVAYYKEDKMDNLRPLDDEHSTTCGLSKPRARRAQMLGAMNGTPAKVRSMDVELEEDNTADISAPASTIPRSARETKTNVPPLGESKQQDDVQATASIAKETAARTAIPTPRRIPTPARPPKSELPASEPMRTRHNSAPGQLRRQPFGRENKENSDKLLASDKISGTGVVQTRSGRGFVGTAAGAPKRSMVPRRGGKK